jgi:hypothetical protein
MYRFNIPIIGDSRGMQIDLMPADREETVVVVLTTDEYLTHPYRSSFRVRSVQFCEIDILTLVKGIKAVKGEK